MNPWSQSRYVRFIILFVSISWTIWIAQAWPKDAPDAVQNLRKTAHELIKQAKAGSEADKEAKYEKAISALQKAIRLDERSSIVTSCNLGVLFESRDLDDAAADTYQQAIRIKPSYSFINLLLSRTYAKLGFHRKAISCYLEMIRMQTDDPETLYELGLLFKNYDRKLEAIAFLEEAVYRKDDYAQAYYVLGTLYEFEQDEMALEAFKKAVSLKPNFWQAYISQGRVHDRLGNLNEALAAYNQALEVIPENISKYFVHSQRGEIYQKLNHWQEAAAALEKASQLKPYDGETLLKLGFVYGELNRHQDAIVTFHRAIQLSPNNAKAYYELARIHYKLRQWTNSVEAFQKATYLKPDFAEAHNKLGEAYSELKLYREAAQAHRKAVLLRPAEFKYSYKLGLAFKNLGLHEEANMAFNKAISLNPHNAEAHYQLGLGFRELGRLQEALEAFKKALSVNQNYIEAHTAMGIVYGKLGRYQEAAEAHQKALLLRPNDLELLCNMGVAYSNLRQQEKALEALNQVIQFNPQFSLAFYHLGIVHRELGQRQEAVEAFKKAIEITPDFFKAYNNLGLVYKELGRFQEARLAFEKLVDQMPSHAGAQFNLGLIYLFLDNQSAAEEQYGILQDYDQNLSQKLFNEIETFKNSKLAMRLKSWREKKDINRMQLSLLLEVPVETIEKWENGKTKIPPFLFLALDSLNREWPKLRANYRE
jgi:superkiller protein 3